MPGSIIALSSLINILLIFNYSKGCCGMCGAGISGRKTGQGRCRSGKCRSQDRAGSGILNSQDIVGRARQKRQTAGQRVDSNR